MIGGPRSTPFRPCRQVTKVSKHLNWTSCFADMSALYSPVADKMQRPPSERSHRMSPYLLEGQTLPGNMNSNHGDDDISITNVSRDLESAYTKDMVNPQGKNSPQISRPISGSSSPLSYPSSPEQGTRRSHHGGVKLPGMTDGRVENVKLTR